MLPHILCYGRMISAPTGYAFVKKKLILLLQRHSNREDARSDENNAFMSEDSTKVRRANKGVEKRKI